MEMSEIIELVLRHDEAIKNLVGWQKEQNGAIKRILQKQEQIYFWLIGLMGGMVSTMILLLINISLVRR